MALALNEPFVYMCLNSGLLVGGGVPIIVEGCHLGNFVCEQVQDRSMTDREARRHAIAIGIIRVPAYKEALAKVPQMTKENMPPNAALMMPPPKQTKVVVKLQASMVTSPVIFPSDIAVTVGL